MLLLHQVGSVKIGEVVRYTVTYTPSHDRILPSPECLYLRIRNTSPLPLRAAFIHGPYTLSVSACPAHYNPNTKFENTRRYGVPEFEPMLKAAGTWSCQLVVPDNIRESAGMGAARGDFAKSFAEGEGSSSASWIIEIASQVIFSSSAGVGYEILLARDEKSLSLTSVPVVKGQAHVHQPGKVSDFQESVGAKDGHHPAQPKGVFSKAVTLKVEDTASLWNTPKLPGWDDPDDARTKEGKSTGDTQEDSPKQTNPKKIHLVVLTHGLHSNIGADLLFLKESIDASVRQAKIDAKKRKARNSVNDEGASETDNADQDSDDEEEVIVRGFSGNATRTERGIKFLGKRLARYILSMTYPDQPFLPTTKKTSDSITTVLKGEAGKADTNGPPAHKHSTIHAGHDRRHYRKFKITSISLVAHSLGGLVQTYAVAYVQKHSPQFFDLIRPVNFIALATPYLGLSNENPLYVKFALDFGLVGRTGQDLGLTWRAPTIARSGWGAIVSTLGESAHKKVLGEAQSESKPLLRILPTGPAHTALKKFRNRTVYSNVVNDGIVPLRTSCLLFLDWQGLERVEKARREAGLVETVMGFGWAELTGAGMSSRMAPWTPDAEEPPSEPSFEAKPENSHEDSHEVPQPSSNAVLDDDRQSLNLAHSQQPQQETNAATQNSQSNNDSPFSGFLNIFRSSDTSKTSNSKSPPRSPKENKIYMRSQTLKMDDSADNSASSSRTRVSSGHELEGDQGNGMSAPPRTSFFESAGDLLNPKLPTVEFLVDPSKRPRTIFHDRVYHPSDIPPPPLKRRSTGPLAIRRRTSRSNAVTPKSINSGEGSSISEAQKSGVGHQDSNLSTHDYDDRLHTDPDREPDHVVDGSNMKVEEKIARAYHRDLSWRKVLVKLEPDAHNNIIVRRTFANAFGWPVVKHLVDAHFSDEATARMRVDNEDNSERAKDLNSAPDGTGRETEPESPSNGEPKTPSPQKEGIHDSPIIKFSKHRRTDSETLEATDAVPDLPSPQESRSQASHSYKESPTSRGTFDGGSVADSATWSDRDFADSENDSEIDVDLLYGPERRGVDEDAGKGKDGLSEKDKDKESGWNWTEKIVGKGASARKAPSGTQTQGRARKRPGSGSGGEEQATADTH
ncbi:DUF676-domain-containing protein [Xylariaceae sp. FL0255]|nr:DUF676-domain-containing protein [Xylariaceae sp. FL0255]